MSVSVLIRSPYFGMLWLGDAEWFKEHVEGFAEDDSVPEGRSWMNFPLGCVDRVWADSIPRVSP